MAKDLYAQKALSTAALVVFGAVTLWINYEVKVKVQGGAGESGSVQEMGNVKLHQTAPDFSAFDLATNKVSLSDYRGKKVVLVDFWATWCGPCRAAMVGLQPLVEKYKARGLEILSLDQGEEPDPVRAFITRKKYAFHVLLDRDQKIANAYGVRGIPTLILVDKNGVIQWMAVGYGGNDDAVEQAVANAVK